MSQRRLRPRCRGLIVVLDGLGDRPHPDLDDLTPLEAANVPTLDRLAATGVTGSTSAAEDGQSSDTATGTAELFGVRADQLATLARGPVEAAGVGLDLEPGDIALRCNFATLRRNGNGFTLLERRAGRIREGTEALADSLQDLELGDGIRATVRPASQHRAVARLSGPGLSHRVTPTDPGSLDGPVPLPLSRPRDPDDPGAIRAAAAVNALTHLAYQQLASHPVNLERAARGLPMANGLITRGAGAVTPLGSLLADAGLQVAVVAAERTIVGLGRLLGFHVETRPEFTAMPDTDIAGKVRSAVALTREHDIVYVHVKAPDVCAHDRRPDLKRQILERLDAALEETLTGELAVAVCGDHCTDSNTGHHCEDPVPALIHVPGAIPDTCAAFDERSCAAGSLGRLRAGRFLEAFLDRMCAS